MDNAQAAAPVDPWAEALAPVAPWPMPAREDCYFYTCIDFPDGGSVDDANWDIRGQFADYIGGYDLTGKTVLDVGTASGFLAFSAEEAGAAQVTALEAMHAREFPRIPFQGSVFTEERARWIGGTEKYLNGLKRSFWYTWHKRQSRVEALYLPAQQYWRIERRFDVVIVGAIVEHMSDPVSFLGNLARLANEAVIIAFTPVGDGEEMRMEPMNDWSQPQFNYSWWRLSMGLYRRIFANMGFEIVRADREATALCNEYDPPIPVRHPTLIARRIRN
jgi:hypothetical protein